MIFTAVNSRPTAGLRVGVASRMNNSSRACRGTYVPFHLLLFLLTFALACVHWISSYPQTNSFGQLCEVPFLPVWIGAGQISQDCWQLVKRHGHRPIHLGCLQNEDRRPKTEDRRPKTKNRRPESLFILQLLKLQRKKHAKNALLDYKT